MKADLREHLPPASKIPIKKQPRETKKKGVKFITEIEVPDDTSSHHSRMPSTTSVKSKPPSIPKPACKPVEETKEADSESIESDFSFELSEGERA